MKSVINSKSGPVLKKKYFLQSRKKVMVFFLLLTTLLIYPITTFAFKPKVHIHIALRAIELILPPHNLDMIVIDGEKYDADPEICAAIRSFPGHYLAGAIGPDGFPDIVFGQAKIHPDLRCDYSEDFDGDCDTNANNKSLSDEWLRYILDCAYQESGLSRQKALAFACGYISHAVGDMWSHTFVNQYALGSWPENFTDTENQNIIKRHLIVEEAIGKHAPNIQARVNNLGGIDAPLDFIHKIFIESNWARNRSDGTVIGMLHDFKAELSDIQPDLPEISWEDVTLGILTLGTHTAFKWLGHHYIGCMMKAVDSGLEEWPLLSLNIARDLFVNEDTDRVWEHLDEFKENHLGSMLGINPIELISSCTDIPNPIQEVIDATSDIVDQLLGLVENLPVFNLLKEFKERIRDYLFEKAFGITYDEFVDYFRNPDAYFDPSRELFSQGIYEEVHNLMHLNTSNHFDDQEFAIVNNAIILTKLTLLNPTNLDSLLFRYNVGKIYTNADYPESEKKINVMLGFIKSLDGNHQWCKNAPSYPINQALISFSKGMPLWMDCLGRKNFFKKVFKDWISDDISMMYYEQGGCRQISSLPPVTTRARIIGAEGGRAYAFTNCSGAYAEITLINHQSTPQDYAIYVTMEVNQDLITSSQPLSSLQPCGTDIPSFIQSVGIEDAPSNIFFHKVETGVLEGTGDKWEEEIVNIQLPNCAAVNAIVRVHILEKLYSASHPILQNNFIIEPNPNEYLNENVRSIYSFPITITCLDDCPGLPPCTENPQTGQMERVMTTVSPLGISLTIILPCDDEEIGCYPGTKDADGDGVSNSDDNCPLTANPSQLDFNSNGIGNACDHIPIDYSQKLEEWIDGRIPNERMDSVLEKLRELGLLDFPEVPEPPGPSPTPIHDFLNDEQFKLLAPSVKKFTQAWIDGKIKDSEFLRGIRPLATGLSFKTVGTSVDKIELKQQSRFFGALKSPYLLLTLKPRKKGSLTVFIPRDLLDSKSRRRDKKFSVLVDGIKIQHKEINSSFVRSITVTVNADTRKVEIFGNRIGPGK